MTMTVIEFILLLLSHAAAGIYSCDLKYNKRSVYFIWGVWVSIQIGVLFYTEYILTNWTAKFVFGFLLALLSQYVIYFITTKGKFFQRLFVIVTYSIFFCIVMVSFNMVRSSIY